MLVNRIALLEYDVPGPTVIHERMVIEHVINDEYVVCTPDRDIFVEQLSVENQDLKSFRLRPSANQLPPGVNPAQLYSLPGWNPGEVAAIKDEGRRLAVQERGLRAAPGGAVAAPPAGAAAPLPVAVAADAVSVCPGASNLTPGVATWVAAEAIDGVRYGQVIDGVLAQAVIGAKTVHTMADGRSLFCMCVTDVSADDFNNRIAACDGRINRRKLNALGTPEVPLSDAVSASKQFDMGWKMTGPRTAQWCLNYLVVEGLGLEAHHERFRQLCRLDSAAWGVQEHFQLSMMLRQLLQVDSFNGCNSLGIELMFRRLQTIEYAHAEKARENESRLSGGKLALEEQYVFGSVVRHAGTLMIAPSLLSYVKEETEKEVLLAKNLRKAKEERELAAKKGGKKQSKNEEGP